MFVTDLIIENASLDDSGIYTCRSSSRQVIDTTKVTVIRCTDRLPSKSSDSKSGTSSLHRQGRCCLVTSPCLALLFSWGFLFLLRHFHIPVDVILLPAS
ncbi:hypothetical protein ACOMHN_065720 [Nucella lapillus]